MSFGIIDHVVIGKILFMLRDLKGNLVQYLLHSFSENTSFKISGVSPWTTFYNSTAIV